MLIIVRQNLCVEEVHYGDGMAEVIGLTIGTGRKERRKIIVTYVPPKTNAWQLQEHKEMYRQVIENLDHMLQDERRILLVGDFNCKGVDWSEMDVVENSGAWSEKMLQLSMENMLEQWVKEATRYREEAEPSLLDLVFTKKPESPPTIQYSSPMGKSDHVMMEIEMSECEVSNIREDHKEERLNYARANFEELRNFFGRVNWKNIMNNRTVQEKCEIFLENYYEATRQYVPLYKVKKNTGPWYNGRCAEAKKTKDKAWKKLKTQRNENNSLQYRKARNEYVRIRREEERNFERDVVQKCADEPRLFYKYVNNKIRNKERIEKIVKEGMTYQTTEDMSEIINECFKTVFTEEEDFTQPSNTEQSLGMQEIEVSKEEIKGFLENMDVRKAMGPDGVSGWVLKECREQLTDPVWELVNSSIKEGKVPQEWKRANIIPLFKGGKSTEPLNYRPVSLTSVMGKICESVIKDKWVKYLEDNQVISEKQFGFRKGRSCVTNLISFYSRVIDGLDGRDGWVDTVYLDIKKAFDKVPHNRLLWKLENIGGVRGKMLDWMRDYLRGREMRTVIRDTYSSWGKVTSGVPQGSVLAPIMFQVYLNDIHCGVDSYMSLFADDAKLMRIIRTHEDCLLLQEDLDKIYNWSKMWKLDFNPKKCHVLNFGKSKRRPMWNYTMGDIPLNKAKEEKDLGVIIQETLGPERHISKIFGTTYNMLTNIRVAFHYMDKEMMKKIITSMIRPQLEYAAVVWSPHLQKDIRKIERLQKAATKMVPELRDLQYEERLREMGLPTLQERRERGDLITLYKIVNGFEKMDKQDLVEIREEMGRTRGHSKKNMKKQCVKDVRKYSFPYRTVEAWNALNEEVISAHSVHNFKEKLDRWRCGDRTL